MNTRHTSWTHTGLAFGLGLAFLKPRLLLACALMLTIFWIGWRLSGMLRKNWPGLAVLLPLVADFLMLSLIVSLLLGVLWFTPPVPGMTNSATVQAQTEIIQGQTKFPDH